MSSTASSSPPGSPSREPLWLPWRAAQSPDREALACEGRQWSFGELAAAADDRARRLRAAGLAPGDRVALLLDNGPELVLLLHAVPRAGGIAVPLDPRLAAAEVVDRLERVAPRLLVVADPAGEAARAGRAPLPALDVLAAGDAEPSLASLEPAAGELRDALPSGADHSLVFTSGTGGPAKAVRLTAGNQLWSALASASRLGVRPTDRWLLCLPLAHVGGLAILVRSCLFGLPVELHRRFDPEAVDRAIDEAGATVVSLVPTMLHRLLEARGGRPFPSTLRCVLVGGGPVPPGLLDACRAAGVPAALSYGLTETASLVAARAPGDLPEAPGPVGRPLFPNRIRVAGEGGEELSPEDEGEIQIQGPVVTPGDWNAPAEDAAALTDGWLRTGDIGRLTADGELVVLDRRDDRIVTGGENVSPAEVEAVLEAHPAVAEAAVVGLPDEEWGQRIAAVVVLAPGATADAETLRAWCRERLARFEVPKEIRLAAELPRSTTGKLLRQRVREGMQTSTG